MLKKFGMVSVGITAGLLAVAPMASASEGHHGGDQDGTGNIKCSASSDGDFNNDTEGEGLVGIGQVAGPIASGNSGQLLSCNSFLNDNLNENNISVGVLGSAIDSD